MNTEPKRERDVATPRRKAIDEAMPTIRGMRACEQTQAQAALTEPTT